MRSNQGMFSESNQQFNFAFMEKRRLEQLIVMANMLKLSTGIQLLAVGSAEDRKHNIEIANELLAVQSSFDIDGMENLTRITNKVDKILSGRIEHIDVDEDDIKVQLYELMKLDNIKSSLLKAIKTVPAGNLDKDQAASLTAFKRMIIVDKDFSSESEQVAAFKSLVNLEKISIGIVKTVIGTFLNDYFATLYATASKVVETYTKQLNELDSPSSSFRP